jgi:hypothetical protein
MFPSCAEGCFPHVLKDVSLTYHLSEPLALVPVSETLHNFKVDSAVPRIRVLCSGLQMVLIVVFNGADIVDDGRESLLAERTLRLYLQDQSTTSHKLQSIILYPLYNVEHYVHS